MKGRVVGAVGINVTYQYDVSECHGYNVVLQSSDVGEELQVWNKNVVCYSQMTVRWMKNVIAVHAEYDLSFATTQVAMIF